MRITIDEQKCMGHGRCYSVSPNLLSDDDEGFVAQRGQCWQVPEGLEGEARAAVGACPESAIRILDGPED